MTLHAGLKTSGGADPQWDSIKTLKKVWDG